MKKLIVFDLDGTLAESKSALDPEMAELLAGLLSARLLGSAAPARADVRRARARAAAHAVRTAEHRVVLVQTMPEFLPEGEKSLPSRPYFSVGYHSRTRISTPLSFPTSLRSSSRSAFVLSPLR